MKTLELSPKQRKMNKSKPNYFKKTNKRRETEKKSKVTDMSYCAKVHDMVCLYINT